jgi:glucose/arabinose dehydrogenase
MPKHALLITLGFTVALAGCDWGDEPTAEAGEVFKHVETQFQVETVAENLKVPWALAWEPDGRMLVTERTGGLVAVDPETGKQKKIADVPGVDVDGEHGLMGMALSPDYAKNGWIFLAYTTQKDEKLVNRVARFTLKDDKLTDQKVLVDDLPAADYHDGLPLRFGPDGKLYASTGDATEGKLAQRKGVLAGKYLRLNPDGGVPADNPYDWKITTGALSVESPPKSPIWSLGHRNSQGFDWHPRTGEMYSVEHGPSFGIEGMTGGDELNHIVKGGNYGWPLYHHKKNEEPYIAPLETWTPAIAPAGAAFYTGMHFPKWRGRFFWAGLRGQALWSARFDKENPRKVLDISRTLHKKYGRLRAVAMGPDGYLYFTTSNRDKRGEPAKNDDRVLRIITVRK